MIKIDGLTKIYNNNTKKALTAVDNLNLEIKDGSIVGLLGPNGAGKSTLIKMILGVMYPTKGFVTIDGKNTFNHRKQLMNDIGIVFGQRSQLWWDLPAMDTFSLLRRVYGVDKDEFDMWLDEIINEMDACEIVNKPVRLLSLGQRMRCEIIAALCFKPRIIVLDEPTIGLDISVKEKIRNFLVYLNRKKNVTILLTTHDLTDVDAICDRVIVLNHGKVLYDDTSSEINEKNSGKNCEIVYAPHGREKGDFPFEAETVDISSKKIITFKGDTSDVMKAIIWCSQHGDIEDVNITKPKIEDIVKNFY